MVVTSSTITLSSLQTNLQTQIFTSCNQISPFLLLFGQIQSNPTRLNTQRRAPNSSNGVFSVKAYMENQNSISSFANKVIGSLPFIGLAAKIISDEGGVGSDIIDFAEFRRGAGDPLHVLMRCWLAAVRAGLLKSEEILEGAARLRISNDIEFEEQTFIALMNEAREAVKQPEMERIVKDQVRKVAECSDEINYPESKPLPKEAVQQQNKNLQFLKQSSET